MSDAQLTSLKRTAVRLLRKYQSADESSRTPILRQLAETFVDARQHFLKADGTADLKGRAWPYRMWVSEIYGESGIPKDTQSTVQSAARYHISNVLRERYDAETLKAHGLSVTDAREQSASRRANRTAVLNALSAKDLHGGALLAISAAWTVLSKVDADDLAELDDHAREVADATLRDAERTIRTLRKRLTPAE